MKINKVKIKGQLSSYFPIYCLNLRKTYKCKLLIDQVKKGEDSFTKINNDIGDNTTVSQK